MCKKYTPPKFSAKEQIIYRIAATLQLFNYETKYAEEKSLASECRAIFFRIYDSFDNCQIIFLQLYKYKTTTIKRIIYSNPPTVCFGCNDNRSRKQEPLHTQSSTGSPNSVADEAE